jgi:hypothetical protein
MCLTGGGRLSGVDVADDHDVNVRPLVLTVHIIQVSLDPSIIVDNLE